MTQETKVEMCMLLPTGSECGPCAERLRERVLAHRGIEVAHVDLEGATPRFCVHYDPELVSVDAVRALAAREGSLLAARYQHETWQVSGLDCADCAHTLEAGVARLEGVVWVSVNFAASTLALEYDAEQVDRAHILSRVRSLGYDVGQPADQPPAAELVYTVKGLDCADCASHLQEALEHTVGVEQAMVDFSLARLRVSPRAGADVRAEVARVARDMGYEVLADEDTAPPAELGWRHRLWRRRRDLTTLGAGLLIAVATLLHLVGAPEALVTITFIAAILVGGWYVARAGWAAARTARSLDMNALMTIAALGAIVVGEWAEGAVTMFLFSLGNTLEGYTMDRARNAIRGLMDLSPRRATVIAGDKEEMVPIEAVRPGQHVLVRPGERVPVDGTVLSGDSAVNQAPITGESVPVDKAPGAGVYAGTLNGQGALVVRVTRLAADTTIARIIKMVEEAQTQKAPAQRFVDRFARVYTPSVIAGAAAIAVIPPLWGWLVQGLAWGPLFATWFYRALVLLVIACPCALVISTPVTIVSAIASAARSGVLIKGGAYLEALGSLRVMALDKTGTLTLGQPQVVNVRCLEHPEGVAWAECATCLQALADAAAVERHSEHPLARAVVQAAEANGLSTGHAAEAVQALTGRGVRGRVNGHSVTVGDHSLIHHEFPELVQGPMCQAVHASQAAGQTAMVVRDDCCGVRGYIAVADTLRPGVAQILAELKRVGIQETVMLTGDNQATAQAIADSAGIDRVAAGLLPEQKVEAVEALLARYGAVAMVGDGVNDAPALARATVGIAMGAAGTDTALETADVALMADDLSRLPFAIRLSRRARAVIRQNVALSLGIKVVFVALALVGVATLWMAVFADVGASLLVTLNGMRLLRDKPGD